MPSTFPRGLISSNSLTLLPCAPSFCTTQLRERYVTARSRGHRISGLFCPERTYAIRQGSGGTIHCDPACSEPFLYTSSCITSVSLSCWRFRGDEVSRKKGRRLFSKRPNNNPPPHYLTRAGLEHFWLSRPSRAADLVPLELVQTTPGTTTHPPSCSPPDQGTATFSAHPGLPTRAGGCSVPSAETQCHPRSSYPRPPCGAAERRGDAALSSMLGVERAPCSLSCTRTVPINATAPAIHVHIRSRCYRCR